MTPLQFTGLVFFIVLVTLAVLVRQQRRREHARTLRTPEACDAAVEATMSKLHAMQRDEVAISSWPPIPQSVQEEINRRVEITVDRIVRERIFRYRFEDDDYEFHTPLQRQLRAAVVGAVNDALRTGVDAAARDAAKAEIRHQFTHVLTMLVGPVTLMVGGAPSLKVAQEPD